MNIKRTLLLWTTVALTAAALASCESSSSVALYRSGTQPSFETGSHGAYDWNQGMTPPSTQLQ